MATPSTTNSLANIAQYEWSCNLLQANAFNSGAMNINQGRDVVLMVENAALTYGLAQNLSNNTAIGVYVYQLVGQMLQPSYQVLTGGSGGGVVPPPSGGGGSISYYPINVILDSGTITSQYVITNVDWKGLTQLSPTLTLNDTQYTLNVNYTYSVVNGSFDFSLSGYQPQVGDSCATFGFKTVS